MTIIRNQMSSIIKYPATAPEKSKHKASNTYNSHSSTHSSRIIVFSIRPFKKHSKFITILSR